MAAGSALPRGIKQHPINNSVLMGGRKMVTPAAGRGTALRLPGVPAPGGVHPLPHLTNTEPGGGVPEPVPLPPMGGPVGAGAQPSLSSGSHWKILELPWKALAFLPVRPPFQTRTLLPCLQAPSHVPSPRLEMGTPPPAWPPPRCPQSAPRTPTPPTTSLSPNPVPRHQPSPRAPRPRPHSSLPGPPNHP